MTLHWRDLGNKPVEITIEDVYLLVVSSASNESNAEEDEERAQAVKAEKLESAEILQMRGQTDSTTRAPLSYTLRRFLRFISETHGLWDSLVAKIVNNIQITVKNIHVRYEDDQSCPGVCPAN